MSEAQLMERITLDSQVISFHRLRASSAQYYHWHQCVEFLYISKGYGIVVVDNQHYTARPGRLFIFPPFRLHKVHVEASDKNQYHRTTMHIEHSSVIGSLQAFARQQAQFSALAASNVPAQVYDLSEQAEFMEVILGGFDKLDPTAHSTASDVAFMVMQIMAFLPAQPQAFIPQQPTVASRIMQWVENNYSTKFSLDELAQSIGLSRSYTSRIFRQQTGGSIHEYLLTRRIKKSCDLLRTSPLSIDAIAQEVGFIEDTYFITCFKKMMNQTPLQYRKQSRAQLSDGQKI
ncbi:MULTISPECIES: AraC family transcriptional regulator [Buttiauxella]|uniref:AraC family transcriptional regulator n=1 Tax=Buttiauxella ferragutiae ATCC 51602 TaxID=1354252 RepID=A0ABX2W6N6_9ENTR|nr:MULTISPECIES: AraC family transcriptional regulator [Buttiauxella]AYN26485.1 AraC family transcriptional regulator [Buttiauxella sp. 3AFRM03]OAT26607.1 AraC family transcriptional regulator [Buttiauxella ferragutiae ATCC 51602]TDN54765.1 AraC-like protein [Buttiauxella sp. JUb87]UNK63280.1 AraC family transcriptional regulator [Buttiauxella ferragutiae]